MQEFKIRRKISLVLFLAATERRTSMRESGVEEQADEFAAGGKQLGTFAGVVGPQIGCYGTEKGLLYKEVKVAFEQEKILEQQLLFWEVGDAGCEATERLGGHIGHAGMHKAPVVQVPGFVGVAAARNQYALPCVRHLIEIFAQGRRYSPDIPASLVILVAALPIGGVKFFFHLV